MSIVKNRGGGSRRGEKIPGEQLPPRAYVFGPLVIQTAEAYQPSYSTDVKTISFFFYLIVFIFSV